MDSPIIPPDELTLVVRPGGVSSDALLDAISYVTRNRREE